MEKKCDISRRILKLKFVIEDGMVKIGVRNTFDSPVLYENGEIKSTRLVSAETDHLSAVQRQSRFPLPPDTLCSKSR